jgi:hypothetical protein
MDFAELKRRLQSSSTFDNLEHWNITRNDSGLVSPNSYRFQRDDRDCFVKEIEENERRILLFLAHSELKIGPKIACPELLEQDIAVYEYIHSTPLKTKTLPQELIRNHARLQNTFCASFAMSMLGRLEDFGYASLEQSRESCQALLVVRVLGLPKHCY